MKPWLTLDECVTRTGIPPAIIQAMASVGDFPKADESTGKLRFSEAAVQRWQADAQARAKRQSAAMHPQPGGRVTRHVDRGDK